ncbi:MAG: TadE/TadG family type IV pilus assembly protein [Microbacterium sp.]|uniref:TadE/TadG family type IV pilus assembly protein n=1 Tax=Microbacterium sp. TaxID=51671 RepID=UPI0039E24416
MRPRWPSATDERGSAPVEFVLVGTLLTALTLAVLQLGLAVYVRNVLHDAAVEGAYHAALADTSDAEGVDRTREVIARAIGADYAQDVTVGADEADGYPVVRITVRAPLPLIGLIGLPGTWEVTGSAPAESVD